MEKECKSGYHDIQTSELTIFLLPYPSRPLIFQSPQHPLKFKRPHRMLEKWVFNMREM